MKTGDNGSGRGMPKSSGVIRIELSEESALEVVRESAPLSVRSGAAPVEVLVAEDATSMTCNRIVEQLGAGYRPTRSSSVQDAGELLKSREFGLILIPLDLQPAPQAAARLADFALDHGVPVVLVTRSLRWLPATSTHLRLLPWVSPEVALNELHSALADAVASAALLRNEPDGDRKSFGF